MLMCYYTARVEDFSNLHFGGTIVNDYIRAKDDDGIG